MTCCTPLEPPAAVVSQTPPSTTRCCDDIVMPKSRKQQQRRRSLVSFGKIEVREYERIITDDDPFVSLGLALGWEYRDGDAIPVQELVADDEQHNSNNKNKKTKVFAHYRLSTSQRLKILKDFGYSNKEIIHAERSRVNTLEYVSSCPCIPLMILKRNVKSMYKLSSSSFSSSRKGRAALSA